MANTDFTALVENGALERATEFVRWTRFSDEWKRRQALGQVQAFGGTDYQRVARLWHRASYPNNVSAFIAANATPP